MGDQIASPSFALTLSLSKPVLSDAAGGVEGGEAFHDIAVQSKGPARKASRALVSKT